LGVGGFHLPRALSGVVTLSLYLHTAGELLLLAFRTILSSPFFDTATANLCRFGIPYAFLCGVVYSRMLVVAVNDGMARVFGSQ
jgi:hypothetical protein